MRMLPHSKGELEAYIIGFAFTSISVFVFCYVPDHLRIYFDSRIYAINFVGNASIFLSVNKG